MFPKHNALSLPWASSLPKPQARSPQETHLGPRVDSAPLGYRSSHPCVHHPPWTKAPGNASQENLGSLPSVVSHLPPPPWHMRGRGCSMHNAAFDIRPAVGRLGRVGGATQPAGQIVLALSGLGTAPPCLSTDCFMPIRLWHIPHILGSRYSLVLVRVARAGEGREHPRNQGWSCSLPDGHGPHTPRLVLSLSANVSLAVW